MPNFSLFCANKVQIYCRLQLEKHLLDDLYITQNIQNTKENDEDNMNKSEAETEDKKDEVIHFR